MRFNKTAKDFFDLRYDDGWDARVLRWGIIIGLDLVIPAALAAPVFYYTGFVRPVGWIIRGSTWMGCCELCTILILMVMLRLGSKPCCCGVGRPRGRHWHKPDSPNRRRHSRPEANAPHEVV